MKKWLAYYYEKINARLVFVMVKEFKSLKDCYIYLYRYSRCAAQSRIRTVVYITNITESYVIETRNDGNIILTSVKDLYTVCLNRKAYKPSIVGRVEVEAIIL